MIYLVVAIGVGLVAFVQLPFWVGPGGLLAAGSSVTSPEALIALKNAIVKRYLEDERAHGEGALGNLAWDRRRTFLVNRYVDASRRLDYLEHSRGGKDPVHGG
jgi:hypothetical protein